MPFLSSIAHLLFLCFTFSVTVVSESQKQTNCNSVLPCVLFYLPTKAVPSLRFSVIFCQRRGYRECK